MITTMMMMMTMLFWIPWSRLDKQLLHNKNKPNNWNGRTNPPCNKCGDCFVHICCPCCWHFWHGCFDSSLGAVGQAKRERRKRKWIEKIFCSTTAARQRQLFTLRHLFDYHVSYANRLRLSKRKKIIKILEHWYMWRASWTYANGTRPVLSRKDLCETEREIWRVDEKAVLCIHIAVECIKKKSKARQTHRWYIWTG